LTSGDAQQPERDNYSTREQPYNYHDPLRQACPRVQRCVLRYDKDTHQHKQRDARDARPQRVAAEVGKASVGFSQRESYGLSDRYGICHTRAT
jgi:hypothetical protein